MAIKKRDHLAVLALAMFGSTTALAQDGGLVPADSAATSLPDTALAPTAAPAEDGTPAAAMPAEVSPAAPAEPPAAAPQPETAVSTTAAESTETVTEWPSSPLYEGTYIAPMASYIIGSKGTENGYGGILNLGYRKGWYAIEVSGSYSSLSAKVGGGNVSERGGGINGLLFPYQGLPNLYAILGVGGLEVRDYAVNVPGGLLSRPSIDKLHFSTTYASAGLGYIWSFAFGRYEFGLRTEALYRYSWREKRVNPDGDIDAPRELGDTLINVGLQLPLALKAPPPPPPAEPVKVVAPVAPADTDGDGVIDTLDQCPDTPAGTKVDAKGCSLPPCKTPAPGERISLSGCGSGEVIVLHGVSFEFNKSRLAVNAKTILDNVADELKANPEIAVELGGHTDSIGGDEYNQKLSEQRAQSVMAYLIEKGVNADKLSAVGYGESQPVADNATEDGREQNRRVELKVMHGAQAAEPTADATAAAAPASADAVPGEAPAAAEAVPPPAQ